LTDAAASWELATTREAWTNLATLLVFTNADANPVCLASQFIRLVLSMSITAAVQSQLRNQALEIYSERMALSSFMGHNNIISWFE